MNLKKELETEIFKRVAAVSNNMNINTFVVGGYVRDLLLNRPLKNDIDFVSESDAIILAQKVAENINSNLKVTIFKRFGTAMIRHNNIDIEFVSARKESYVTNSRKPTVEKGSLEDDQNRRDFTINALAISLQTNNFGDLIDPFNGVEDLKNKIICTPLDPDITFSDDPLRMLRAIRFATELNFSIHEDTFQGIKNNVERISIVSMERIMTEFNKIMVTKKPSEGLFLLDKSNLLHYILPELTALKGVEDYEGKLHKDNFTHTLMVLDNICENTDNLWLRWAALLHDIGKAPTKRYNKKNGWSFHGHEFVGSKMVSSIFRRLRLPLGQPLEYVKKLVLLSSRPIPLIDDLTTDSAFRRLLFDANDNLEDLFTLCKADITTKNEEKKKKFINNFILIEKKIKEVEDNDKVANFQPPITGEEIMQFFNLNPSNAVGIIKNAIKEAILDGKIKNNKTDAIDYMIKLGKELNLSSKK